jgi:hypothetical protein
MTAPTDEQNMPGKSDKKREGTVLNLYRLNFYTILYKNSVRTSQETHYVSATKPNRLILFGDTVAVYCENHTEYTNTLCGQNAEF